MPLVKESNQYYDINLPWRLYQHNMLPMGILVVVDDFHSDIGCPLLDLEQVIVYINDIIVLGTGIFELNLKDVDEVLKNCVTRGCKLIPTNILGSCPKPILWVS